MCTLHWIIPTNHTYRLGNNISHHCRDNYHCIQNPNQQTVGKLYKNLFVPTWQQCQIPITSTGATLAQYTCQLSRDIWLKIKLKHLFIINMGHEPINTTISIVLRRFQIESVHGMLTATDICGDTRTYQAGRLDKDLTDISVNKFIILFSRRQKIHRFFNQGVRISM